MEREGVCVCVQESVCETEKVQRGSRRCIASTPGNRFDPGKGPRAVDIRLPGKGNSHSRGARPVYSFR